MYVIRFCSRLDERYIEEKVDLFIDGGANGFTFFFSFLFCASFCYRIAVKFGNETNANFVAKLSQHFVLLPLSTTR